MTRDENGFPRRPPVEAARANDVLIRDGDQRQAARAKNRRAARQARIDAQRVTMRVDIPPALKAHLEKISSDLSIPVSQLANRLIWEGLERLTLDQLKSEIVPGRSMRYANALPYPGDNAKRNRR